MFRSARDFGAAIREKRRALGWTQTELAARSGTGERFIFELESGKPSCQLEKALIVARTVGIEIGDLRTAHAAPRSPYDDLGFLPTFGDVNDDDLLRTFPVAHLTFDGECRLDYDRSWEERRSAFPVSVTMPLHSGPVAADRLLPWLDNLLAGPHLAEIGQRLKVSLRTLSVCWAHRA